MSFKDNDEELSERFISDQSIVFVPGKPVSLKEFKNENGSSGDNKKVSAFYKYLQKYLFSLKNEFSLRRIFPLVDFLTKDYGAKGLFGDVVAGITVTLTLIPMAISFAALAGLPLQYGLYSSILPGLIYAIFGHCPEISIGPTAVACILVYGYADGDVAKSVTLTFFTGLILIIGGFLNLGFLVNYVSRPVLAGFVSGICCQVVSSQLTGLLGLPRAPKRGVVPTFEWIFGNLKQIRPADTTVGLMSIGILLFLRSLKDIKCFKVQDKDSKRYKISEKIKWVISVTRNCFILILTSVVAYLLINVFELDAPMKLTGEIKSGLPEILLPWNQAVTNSTNATGVIEIVEDLGNGIVTLPFINFIQAIAIVKHYSSSHPNRQVYPTQEMITLGLANIFGSFIGSMPVTGSLSRSSVNAASGVTTTLGGVITSVFIIISCIFLTPLLAYIPKSALSAVVMSAIIFTFDVEILRPLWRYKKSEILPFALTLIIGIFYKLQIGLVVGIISHLLIVLYWSTSPVLDIQRIKIHDSKVEYISIKADRSLYFTTVDTLKSKIFNLIRDTRGPSTLLIVLDLTEVPHMDFSVATALRSIEAPLKNAGGTLYFMGMKRSVESILKGVNPVPLNAYTDLEDAESKLRTIYS